MKITDTTINKIIFIWNGKSMSNSTYNQKMISKVHINVLLQKGEIGNIHKIYMVVI